MVVVVGAVVVVVGAAAVFVVMVAAVVVVAVVAAVEKYVPVYGLAVEVLVEVCVYGLNGVPAVVAANVKVGRVVASKVARSKTN